MDEKVMNKSKNKREHGKKQESPLLLFFFLHFSFLICLILCSCDTHDSSQTSTYKSFEYKLRGTWESNQTESYTPVYSGTIKIDSDSIIIDGYGETQTPTDGDDNNLPFKAFPRGKPLKGYSENGKIYIEYPASVQNEIPYSYTETGEYPNKGKILDFTFGTRSERLQWKEDS